MIKLEFLNKYAKELCLQIIIEFKPTFVSINLNNEVDTYATNKKRKKLYRFG